MPEAPEDALLPLADATIYAFCRNVVVAASAGTGKTYRLTALYVLLALGFTSMGQGDERTPAPPIGPERIVATTFSRAAAAEIASRVERALRELAAWDGRTSPGFGPVLAARAEALGQRLDAADVRRRATDALTRWPMARVDTLHGVARRIVQRHAIALGLAPGIRVLDEEEAQALSDLAVDEALGAALGAGGAEAEAARALIVSAGSVWAARQRVQRLLDRLDEEGLAPRDLALADSMAEGRVVADALLALARRVAALGSTTFREPAAALAAWMERAPGGVLLPEEAVPALAELLTRRMPARGRRLPPDDELDDFIGGLPGKTKAERAAGLATLLRHAPGLREREARIVALLEDARARLAAAKRRAGALGFGDLLRMARDALRDRPEIGRAVREEIDALLVDEFQDTSRVQRDLVYLLREREDAAAQRAPAFGGDPSPFPRREGPSAEGLAPHGLFLVGDRKQSIYGFRGADVAVFSRIAAELAGRAAAVALALPEGAVPEGPARASFVALRESRRSGAAILDFVNAFAERDFTGDRTAGAPPRAFEIAYGPAEHLVPCASPAPPEARVVFVPDDGTSPEDAEPIVRESSGAAREAHVAAAFVASVAGATKYQEIAVLARRRSTIPLVELALARLDIPYVVAGRALYDAPEVRDVAALLRLLLDPRDRLALATVLRGPMTALSDTTLALLSAPGRGLAVPLLGRWKAVPSGAGPARTPALSEATDPSRVPADERARLEAFRGRFAELRGAALRLPPGEAIRAAITAFDLDRVLAALPRAEARVGNLDRLVTLARRRGGTLAAFVRWLERRMRDEADEAEAAVFSPDDDAVRLTTIHASKGLDFPVVVLVDLNAEPRGDAGGLGVLTDFAQPGGAPEGAEAARLVVRHYAPRGAGRALAPLATATLKAAQAEGRAREQAERRRLTYVALTRAQKTLALIGSAAAPRPASAQRALVSGLEQGDLVPFVTAVEPAVALLASARPAPPRPAPPPARKAHEPRAEPRPVRSPAREIAIDAADLALYRDCPRRYRLRCLLGIEEPAGAPQLDLFAGAAQPRPTAALPPPVADDPALHPRPLDRAPHRVIARLAPAAFGTTGYGRACEVQLAAEGLPARDAETARLSGAIASFLEGPYARAAREEGAEVVAAEPFVVGVDAPSGGRRLLLRGGRDVRVARGARVDVLAVSAARAEAALEGQEVPLRAAALAEARAAPEAEVRAGVLALGGAGAEIQWLSGDALGREDHARFEREVGGLVDRLAEARFEDRFEGIAKARCQRLGCGFLGACHGDGG